MTSVFKAGARYLMRTGPDGRRMFYATVHDADQLHLVLESVRVHESSHLDVALPDGVIMARSEVKFATEVPRP
jgi:hypothetical protein